MVAAAGGRLVAPEPARRVRANAGTVIETETCSQGLPLNSGQAGRLVAALFAQPREMETSTWWRAGMLKTIITITCRPKNVEGPYKYTVRKDMCAPLTRRYPAGN